ncbi:MAG TPA: HD domain-containing protein [Solirubrobacteraceae bacterium]|nr:HD domain-containing protein [Solirubrobacteraceae bacterium]
MSEDLGQIPGVEPAIRFTQDAYHTRLRRRGRTVEHPLAVARLLAADGQSPRVVVAGVLHDVLEDTEVTGEELDGVFGAEIAGLVRALSQDPSITKYRRRKAALRTQILDAGPDAAAISLADKAAKLTSLDSRPAERKLDHYRATLSEIEQRWGPSRLSELLRAQLSRWPPR